MGDARRGDLEHACAQRVEDPGEGQLPGERVDIPGEPRTRVGQDRRDESAQRFFVVIVGIEPGCLHLRFLRGLHDGLLHSADEIGIASSLDRPDTEQCLVQRQLVERIRCHAAPDGHPMLCVPPPPSRDPFGPYLGHLGQSVEAGSGVLTAFRVVRRRCRERSRPVALPTPHPSVEFLGAHERCPGVGTDLCPRRHARVAVQRRVLHPLRGGRAGELLPAAREFANVRLLRHGEQCVREEGDRLSDGG